MDKPLLPSVSNLLATSIPTSTHSPSSSMDFAVFRAHFAALDRPAAMTLPPPQKQPQPQPQPQPIAIPKRSPSFELSFLLDNSTPEKEFSRLDLVDRSPRSRRAREEEKPSTSPKVESSPSLSISGSPVESLSNLKKVASKRRSIEEEDSDFDPNEIPEGEVFNEEDADPDYGQEKPSTLLGKRDSPAWEENYTKLLKYFEDNGHIKVKKKLDPKLAQWIVNQRANRRYNILSASRIAKLNALGMDWNPRGNSGASSTPGKKKTKNKRKKSDDEADDSEEEYVGPPSRSNGAVPESSKISPPAPSSRVEEVVEDEELMASVFKAFSSLSEFKVNPKKEHTTLAEAAQARPYKSMDNLKDLLVQPDNPQWEEQYNKLVQFHQQNNHIRVQKKSDIKLAQWIVNQRASYRNGQLSAARIAKLESLGIDWNPRSMTKEKRQRLTRDSAFSSTDSIDSLTNEDQDDRSDDIWNEHFKQIASFKQQHGHFNIPRQPQALYYLYYWAFNQRSMNRKGLLSPEKREKLESIGFSWGPTPLESSTKSPSQYPLVQGTKNLPEFDQSSSASSSYENLRGLEPQMSQPPRTLPPKLEELAVFSRSFDSLLERRNSTTSTNTIPLTPIKKRGSLSNEADHQSKKSVS